MSDTRENGCRLPEQILFYFPPLYSPLISSYLTLCLSVTSDKKFLQTVCSRNDRKIVGLHRESACLTMPEIFF